MYTIFVKSDLHDYLVFVSDKLYILTVRTPLCVRHSLPWRSCSQTSRRTSTCGTRTCHTSPSPTPTSAWATPRAGLAKSMCVGRVRSHACHPVCVRQCARRSRRRTTPTTARPQTCLLLPMPLPFLPPPLLRRKSMRHCTSPRATSHALPWERRNTGRRTAALSAAHHTAPPCVTAPTTALPRATVPITTPFSCVLALTTIPRATAPTTPPL